jgi:hypothetical protein
MMMFMSHVSADLGRCYVEFGKVRSQTSTSSDRRRKVGVRSSNTINRPVGLRSTCCVGVHGKLPYVYEASACGGSITQRSLEDGQVKQPLGCLQITELLSSASDMYGASSSGHRQTDVYQHYGFRGRMGPEA